MSKPRHHWIVRLTHWVNVVAVTIMVGSGLQIFNAYPRFARRGETFCCYPWEGMKFPSELTFGGWLAGARNWHFAMMWLLVANGLLYLGFIYLHGEWRDLVPRRGFIRDSAEMIRFYLFLRKDHPVQGKHNALQRGTYFILPWVGLLTVVSGIAIWKPVQLALLTDLMGGYVWARYWHFLAMVLLDVLSAIHVFMVFATDPYSLRAIITGKYNERNSPEARNARPFYHLLPNRLRRNAWRDALPARPDVSAYPALTPTLEFEAVRQSAPASAHPPAPRSPGNETDWGARRAPAPGPASAPATPPGKVDSPPAPSPTPDAPVDTPRPGTDAPPGSSVPEEKER